MNHYIYSGLPKDKRKVFISENLDASIEDGLNRLLKSVCDKLQVDKQTVLEGSLKREFTEARQMFFYLVKISKRFRIYEAAAFLNNTSKHSAVKVWKDTMETQEDKKKLTLHLITINRPLLLI
jgi:chromosomal replication initiation ATPase DnaA